MALCFNASNASKKINNLAHLILESCFHSEEAIPFSRFNYLIQSIDCYSE